MRLYPISTLETGGIIAGASHYVTMFAEDVSQYSAFELQGRVANLGDTHGRLSFINFNTDTMTDQELARIETVTEPFGTTPGFSAMKSGALFRIKVRNQASATLHPVLTTDGNTFFFGPNSNDSNCTAGSLILRNSAAFYSASASVITFTGSDAADLIAAGLSETDPIYDNFLVIGGGSDEWIQIGDQGGSCNAEGCLLSPNGPVGIQTNTQMVSSQYYGWQPVGVSTRVAEGQADTRIYRGAAGRIDLRNGTNPHSITVSETYTNASNLIWVRLSANAGGPFQLLSEAAGTGTIRPLSIGVQGAADLSFITNSTVQWAIEATTGNLQAGAASTITKAGGELQITTTTSGDITLAPAGDIRLNLTTAESSTSSAAALGNIGGGPASGTQSGWVRFKRSTGAVIWLPYWDD